MANLTGQQIKDTYPGLLNLNTATTGITSTPQQITDGLGNNTGAYIGVNYLSSPTVFNNVNNLVPDFMGNGYNNSPITFPATSQNFLMGFLFYDPGFFAYSAVSYFMTTATTTSDVVDVAFYNTQYVKNYGYQPKDLIQSGITWTSTGAAGIKTTTTPSTLSFSGYGGGFYYMLLRVANAGVTPTVRYGTMLMGTINNQSAPQMLLGYTQRLDTQGLSPILKSNGTASTMGLASSLGFKSSYTASDITTNYNTTITVPNVGFGLNCIK